jgi:hypothetical protein
VCSKEGFHRDHDLYEMKNVNRLVTRCGCKASIRFTVEKGEWKVTHFNPTQNHELAKSEERPFLTSKFGQHISGTWETHFIIGL